MPLGRVAIVGGGIAGLATALALRQQGIASTVYERAPALRELGAGIALWPNGTRVLRDLGILDAIVPKAGRADSVDILTASGKRLVHMDTTRDYAPSLCVRRPDLLDALASAVGPGSVRLGAQVVGVEQRGESVGLSFADGSAVDADLVVVADGLRSHIRDGVFGPTRLGYRGYVVWRGIGTASPDWPRADACEVWGDRQRFGLFRLADDQAYWYVCASRPSDQPSADPRAEAFDVAGSWNPDIASVIDSSSEVHCHLVWDRSVRGPKVNGRVALVGDAAHGMTPDLGQGGAQALVDAYDLAQCLTEAGTGEAALAAFARRQRRRTAPLVLQSRLAGWIGQLGGAPARVRDVVVGATPSRMFAAAFTATY